MTRHVARAALFGYLDKAIRPRYVAVTWLEREGLAMTTTVPALAQDIGLARQTDYFLMKDQLTEDEPGLLHRVRKFAETEVLPVVN